MKAYKGFDKELKCRSFQYEIGKTYEEDIADLCSSGFHACESPLDVLKYYEPSKSRYCEVELEDVSNKKDEDSKRVGKKITIGAEIGISGLAKAHFEHVKSQVEKSVEVGESESVTVGAKQAATAGDRGAATAGDSGAATARGSSATGENGLSVARGNNVKVKGGPGAILVIAEEHTESFDITDWKAVVVDGKEIKADTWYCLEDGELKEVNVERGSHE